MTITHTNCNGMSGRDAPRGGEHGLATIHQESRTHYIYKTFNTAHLKENYRSLDFKLLDYTMMTMFK